MGKYKEILSLNISDFSSYQLSFPLFRNSENDRMTDTEYLNLMRSI